MDQTPEPSLDCFDVWNRTTRAKVAFDVTAEVALHWLNNLATLHGRDYVREQIALMWWPQGQLGRRWTGRALLDLMDSTQLYGIPVVDEELAA